MCCIGIGNLCSNSHINIDSRNCIKIKNISVNGVYISDAIDGIDALNQTDILIDSV